jgi:hypothetical protein
MTIEYFVFVLELILLKRHHSRLLAYADPVDLLQVAFINLHV